MKERLNVTKSMGSDMSVPMATTSLPMTMTRESVHDTEGVWELPISLWRCSSLSRDDSFTFSLVI